MSRNSTIRSVLAGFFLLLFAFSITPRRIMHNLVASHKDGRSNSPVQDPYQSQLTKAVFNCQCDNFIAESPFLHCDTASDPFIEFAYSEYQDQPGYYFISSDSFCFGLRGPPVSQS